MRELFDAARCGGIEVERLPQRPPDWHRVRGVEGDGADLARLQRAVQVAKGRGGWLVLVFHGVGGGHHLSVDRDAFAALLQQLAESPDVSVRPFIDAATELKAADA